MFLLLIRDSKKPARGEPTRGQLFVDFVPFCRTIEPNPDNGKGCIPRGWYRVDVTWSPRFQRNMPILRIVPGFEGIRIHAGLREENTRGCICVGERYNEAALTKRLTETQNNHEEIYIQITDDSDTDAINDLRELSPLKDDACGYIY